MHQVGRFGNPNDAYAVRDRLRSTRPTYTTSRDANDIHRGERSDRGRPEPTLSDGSW